MCTSGTLALATVKVIVLFFNYLGVFSMSSLENPAFNINAVSVIFLSESIFFILGLFGK